MAAANDRGGRPEAASRPHAPQASTAWSIAEIRVIRDPQGRLRIDSSDPATYGAYAARQLLATAEADPKFREGMTKRPSTPSIKITYLHNTGVRRELSVREIFCRMDGDDLVLTRIETADGEKLKDLPIAVPQPEEPDSELDDADHLHKIALAAFGEAPSTRPEMKLEPEAPRPEPPRERRRPTGPLRQYDEEAKSAPASSPIQSPASASRPIAAPSAAEPSPRGPAVAPAATSARGATTAPPATPSIRALDEAEATALRSLIEARAGETRWASGLLMQAAERHPSDRGKQNEYLANLLKVGLDSARAESRTPLAVALRGILEEVHAYKGGVLDRDPLKAEKLALQSFARSVFAPTPVDDGPIKTVSGMAQRTPAQVLAKLEDPKLARATRVRFLLEIVPELIENWRPDKESGHSEAANESSPAIVRRLFAVANEQRQQRKFIDDGASFRKAGDRYKGLESKLPKPSVTDES